MMKEEQKRLYYSQQALYYANATILERIDAYVHLEDRDDEFFWNDVLGTFRPRKYKFIYGSRNDKGNHTTGCIQCLNYKGYLSDKFFVCIDSDYHYLLRESGLDISHYILQTYTYSWENHYCYSKKLQSLWESLCPHIADRFI